MVGEAGVRATSRHLWGWPEVSLTVESGSNPCVSPLSVTERCN